MAYIGGTYTADPNNVAGDYTPVPPGEYGFTIVEADYKATSAGTGHFIYIKCKIDDNDPSGEGGRTFEDRFNIDNPNDKAVEIGQRQLNALLFATGKQGIADTDELVGLSAVAKLKVDPAVSADAARVLRMPDTKHLKGNPLPVQLVQEGVITPLAEFRKLIPAVQVDLSAAKAYGVDAMTRSLATGDYPPSEFARLVRRSLKGAGCAQITHAVQNAASLDEPLWRAALSIAWLCTDAETAIHTLSRSHPEYTPENTVAKAQLTKGPMTCEWYRNNYPDHCAGCQQQVTSPISLGRKIEASVTI